MMFLFPTRNTKFIYSLPLAIQNNGLFTALNSINNTKNIRFFSNTSLPSIIQDNKLYINSDSNNIVFDKYSDDTEKSALYIFNLQSVLDYIYKFDITESNLTIDMNIKDDSFIEIDEILRNLTSGLYMINILFYAIDANGKDLLYTFDLDDRYLNRVSSRAGYSSFITIHTDFKVEDSNQLKENMIYFIFQNALIIKNLMTLALFNQNKWINTDNKTLVIITKINYNDGFIHTKQRNNDLNTMVGDGCFNSVKSNKHEYSSLIKYNDLNSVKNIKHYKSTHFHTAIDAKYYSTKSKPTHVTKNLDDPKKDYSILQLLGFDPERVLIHKYITEKPVVWSYGDIKYVSMGNVNNVSYEDIENFINDYIDEYNIYALLPIIVDIDQSLNREVISLSHQITITKLLNPMELFNHINISLSTIRGRYHVEDVDGILIFKLRVVIYKNKEAAEKISKIPLTTLKENKISKIGSFIDDNIPLSFEINSPIINNVYKINNVVVKGKHYQYKDDVIVFIHDSDISNYRKITIFKNNAKYLECEDYFNTTDNKDIIMRVLENGIKLFIDGKKENIIYTEYSISCKPIKTGDIDLIKDNAISAFDIETYLDENNRWKAYACGFVKYDSKVNLYYISDYKNEHEMFKACFNDMLKAKLGTVYVHNLSKFDCLFINKVLKTDFTSKYNIKDNLILKIIVKEVDNDKYKFVFRDSLLMIPGSLDSLGKSFNTNNVKTIFPYLFVNKDNLNYIGNKPDFKYYNNISIIDYNDIKKDNWSLRDETMLYLKNDLLTLLEIMKRFSNDIYSLENINITKKATISSVSFKALTTNYLESDVLYQVKGRAHENMRSGYYGGVTEVYNLFAKDGVRIYDLNSSYPASMKQSMPIGKPIFSTDPGGLDKYFGVVYANIETPKKNNEYIHLKYPPLPYRKDDGSIINPIGTWTGMYSSELLKYVRDYHNYKINVLYGYKFERSDGLFNDYVDKYYSIKDGSFDGDLNINRNTAKLMLNSCYGRTGMRLDNTITEFVSTAKSKEIQLKYEVISLNQITSSLDWVKYKRKLSDSFMVINNDELNLLKDDINTKEAVLTLKDKDKFYEFEQCLPIAIFTAAYSTIRLFEGIRSLEVNDPNAIVYSVDTDSIHTNGILPPEMIGSGLGLWKLEFEGVEGIYPLPKLYYVKGYKIKDGVKSNTLSEIKKGKGVRNNTITIDEYKNLLTNSSVEKTEPRFIIEKDKSGVNYKNVKITLKPILNKRIKTTNYSTKPILIINGVVKGY